MNPLGGITFYDSLNRLSIGILLTYFFLPCLILESDGCCCAQSNDLAALAVYIIICYIVGLFFTLLIDRLCTEGYRKRCWFLKVFYKNDLKTIVKIADKIKYPIDNSLKSYYAAYYKVQRNGLLGNVPVLEAISAFLLNLCGVAMVYAFIGIILLILTLLGLCNNPPSFLHGLCPDSILKNAYSCLTSACDCPGYCRLAALLIISSITIVMTAKSRDVVELKIYRAIILVAIFLSDNNKPSNYI